jgi:hypothetical protein
MAQILRPSLKLFRGAASLLTKARQRLSEGVGVEVGQSRRSERNSEYRPNGRGVCPAFPRKTGGFEVMLRSDYDARCGKERIVRSALAEEM